ncbi:MAG TPA: hypothetical protein VLG50_07540 [Candidatus Saccharimonadales bacterium]|nr:hypothetical protein [Candidatus Saccharimonadales bacterium]
MADDGGSIFFTVIIIIWLIIITVVLVAFGVGLWTHRIDFGPTGPTGPSGGPVGPTGPTGPSSTTTTTLSMVPPIMMGGTNGQNGQAQCFPCHFSNQGQVLDYQQIPPHRPQVVKWVLNSNTLSSNYNDGTFVLPVGTYVISTDQLATSVVYPSINSQGLPNTGGTYRSMSIWLRDNNVNNVVYENDLIGTVSASLLPNSATTLSFPIGLRFDVGSFKNRLSIITWTNSPTTTEIGALSRFNLIKIA